jgi:hypothetical protein
MAAYRLGRFPALSWRLGAGGAGSGEADSIPPSSPLTITAYLAAQGGSSKSGRSSEPAATKAPSLMIETDNLTPLPLAILPVLPPAKVPLLPLGQRCRPQELAASPWPVCELDDLGIWIANDRSAKDVGIVSG